MKAPVIKREDSIRSAAQAMQANRPLRAEEICRDFLDLRPGCADHMRMLGHALMKQNRLEEAEKQFRFALDINPNYPQLHEDLGSVLGLMGKFEESVTSLQAAVKMEPELPLAHKKLGRALAALGRGNEADESFMEYFDRDPEAGEVAQGADHLKAGRTEEAVSALRGVLRKNPENVDAMLFLSMAYRKMEKHLGDAEALLRKATQVAPDHVSAWLNLGAVLMERNRRMEAIEAFRKATKIEPAHAGAWALLGNAYGVAAYPEEAVNAYQRSIELQPNAAGVQMGYGHVLKTVGDQAGALKAYREAIRQKPRFGEVYWSMANLKVFNFEQAEVTAMKEQLARDDLSDSERVHFNFAMGKAMADQKNWDSAWQHYQEGNQIHRKSVYYDPIETATTQSAIREVFSAEFIASSEGHGHDSDEPILIVGMPRSGSTLVEQILASHSQVEGTAELPELGKISNFLGRYRPTKDQFPYAARLIRDRDWKALGRQYLDETRRYRETERPFFTDKLPNNFSLVGLLHLMLPNAKVINTLRQPLDTLVGNYTQLYGKGQNFSYDEYELGDYYREYYATMQHWHQVLPGKVLDVHYEDTVTDLDTQVRRILEHCGLPFEENCLRFWETERSVKTASSEQVRQPLYTSALGKWRRYDKHLGLWQSHLSEILEGLPDRVKNAGR